MENGQAEMGIIKEERIFKNFVICERSTHCFNTLSLIMDDFCT